MASIVFANKLPPPPKPKVVNGPPPPSATKTVSAPPPKTNVPKSPPPPPPKAGSIVRDGHVIQKGINTKPKTNPPVTEPELPIVETATEQPKPIAKVAETVVTGDDDDWGIMQVTKKKSAKEISKSVQQNIHKSTGKAVALDAAGINLLVETIVTELTNQFVRKDEVYDIITKALQRMVMEDVKPK